MPAEWRLEHPLAATTKTALQGRGTVHRKTASQLVHGTGTGSFIWKLPILASQIRKRRAGPASGMRWALIVLVMCENEKVKGGDTPFTSFSCDASARPLTFNASAASVCNFSIAPSFSASLSLKSAHGKHGHFAAPPGQRLERAVSATNKLHCRAEGRSTENMPRSWYMAPVPPASYGSCRYLRHKSESATPRQLLVCGGR